MSGRYAPIRLAPVPADVYRAKQPRFLCCQDVPEDSVSNSLCQSEESPYLLELLKRPCNTQPCLDYSWVATPWLECSKQEPECEEVRQFVSDPLPGRLYRRAYCVDSLGNSVGESLCQQGIRPSVEEASNWEKEGLCQLPETMACSSNGICTEGMCLCKPGYHGVACQVGSVALQTHAAWSLLSLCLYRGRQTLPAPAALLMVLFSVVGVDMSLPQASVARTTRGSTRQAIAVQGIWCVGERNGIHPCPFLSSVALCSRFDAQTIRFVRIAA